MTLVRWHRVGFRCYWRWKSRSLGGRPQIETDLRVLIRRMSVESPLCDVPRLNGELLKLGFEVAQSSVARYMVRRRGPPSQAWRTSLTLLSLSPSTLTPIPDSAPGACHSMIVSVATIKQDPLAPAARLG